MATITTSDIKRIIQDTMTEYLTTTGKYLIEGIIRDTLRSNDGITEQYNPLVEAQRVIGGNNMQPQQYINQGSNPYPTPPYAQYTQPTTNNPMVNNTPKHRFSSILEQTMRTSGDLSNFADTKDNMV